MSDVPLPGSGAARHGTANADLQIMEAAHHAFRRDVATLARTATRQTLADPVRRVTIGAGWEMFKRQLLLHHRAEDDSVWPVLRDRLADDAAALSVLDEMAAEHELIDPLLAAVDRTLGDERLDLGAVIGELASQLAGHLAHEERDALPLIGGGEGAAEWAGVAPGLQASGSAPSPAEVVPWILDGLPAEQAAAVLAALPAALGERYRTEWKPWYEAVARW
jgi:iron-sulfur cluster repair protein YtfE (RIC family)